MARLTKIFPKRKRGWIVWGLSGLLISMLVSCGPTKLTISHANLKPNGLAATPTLLTSTTTLEKWENTTKLALQNKLQANIYGFLPENASTRTLKHEVLDTNAYNGLGTIEEYTLVATTIFNGTSVDTPSFKMVVVTPNSKLHTTSPAPHPVILMESFCPNHNTIDHPEVSKANTGYSCDGNAVMGGMMKYVFGRYISTPPMEMILEHGYAFATIFPSEYVPDTEIAGLAALKHLSASHTDDNTRWGAIAAWGWGYSRMIDALEQEARFNNVWIPYGHSRYGKAALFAGAFDPRINAVIAHQPGTGGASLNKNKKGESVKEITDTFPHWFSKSYASMAGHEHDLPIDQHALLALNAPHPIFLGNARRDVWSDPNGAFRAAQGANSVYKLYNKQGLMQESLTPFIANANISFYIRPGTHGVVKEDWPAFLEFLDAHFK